MNATAFLISTFDRLYILLAKSRILNAIHNLYFGIRSNQQNIRIMRFAIGVTLTIALSSAIEWPLSFLAPILASIFLAMPIPRPDLNSGLKNMLYTVIAFLIGIVFTLLLLPYPLVYVPMLVLVLFNLYYMLNRGASLWFVLMALMAILILPMLGNNFEGLAKGFALGFVLSGWVTVLMIWLAFLIVPDPADTPTLPKKPGLQKEFSLPAAQAALKSTVVVTPLVIVFITLNLTDLIVVMVFTAIFTLAPDINKGKVAGINMMKSTLIGGFYAFIVYNLLVAVPQYHFFVILMFLVTLIFASNIFSNNPKGVYYASAFSTLYILVNSSLAEGADFTSVFILRFTFIFLATLYVVFSLMLFEQYWPQQQING